MNYRRLLISLPLLIFACSACHALEVVTIASVLGSPKSYNEKELIVFGYFQISGSEQGNIFGRLCMDREAAVNDYQPLCASVVVPDSMKRWADSSDKKFSLVRGTFKTWDIIAAYPGKLIDVTRLEYYQVW